MTRRLALAAAAAAATLAAPAHAVIYPVCATSLANAAAGVTSQCSTDNTPMLSGAVVRRLVTVEVASGVVEATVTCGYGDWSNSATETVSGPQPVRFSVLEQNSSSCRLALRALYANTSAVATSSFGYVFIGPRS